LAPGPVRLQSCYFFINLYVPNAHAAVPAIHCTTHHPSAASAAGESFLSTLLAAPPGDLAPSRPRPVALSFQSVTHRYGTRIALDRLDLDVLQGEVLALLGPNGAGKSTTISALLGLVRPQQGRIEVLGRDPRQSVADGRVGAMLQSGSGIGLPPGVRVDQALGLVRRLYPRPAAFDHIVERADIGALLRRRTDRLSGGQAQRVRFAIAIAGDPEVVFLDEPTSAMDVESRQGFWRMMRNFGNEGRTVLFATHHLAEADEIADRVVVLNHGRVVADGPGATLKAAVATRRLRFVTDLPDRAELSELEGVTEVDVCGTGVSIDSLDADATIRDLVGHGVPFRDLEVTGAGLEQAFVALTGCGAAKATIADNPAKAASTASLVQREL
jgi:ABC-2 type transport system ATP-binding protein